MDNNRDITTKEITIDELRSKMLEFERLEKLSEGVYGAALAWANERGDSSGAQEIRKLLLHLYNEYFEFNIARSIGVLDENGLQHMKDCIDAYRKRGETAELRSIGESIKASRMLDRHIELCKAAQRAKDERRRTWR